MHQQKRWRETRRSKLGAAQHRHMHMHGRSAVAGPSPGHACSVVEHVAGVAGGAEAGHAVLVCCSRAGWGQQADVGGCISTLWRMQLEKVGGAAVQIWLRFIEHAAPPPCIGRAQGTERPRAATATHTCRLWHRDLCHRCWAGTACRE